MVSPLGEDLTGLGRLPQPDKRNANYPMPMRDVPPGVRRRMWNAGEVLDQGATPQCVGYAGYGWLEGGPVINRRMTFSPTDLYHMAQDNDEWPGHDYDGSSTLGLMKALKQLGYVNTYVWATDADTLAKWILTTGPVLIGVNWYLDFFTPNVENGFIEIGGEIVGGHELRVIGVDLDKSCPDGSKGAFRFVNSWGRGWGTQGRAYLSIKDLDRLLQEDGEAVTAIEIKIK
jgi:C1A family cysteine protease